MQVTTHRKTDTGFTLEVEVPVTDDAGAEALGALGSNTAGGETSLATDDDGKPTAATVALQWGPIPVDPESGDPMMTEKAYAEMQVREASLLIQSALDSTGGGKGKKLATEGTTVEVG